MRLLLLLLTLSLSACYYERNPHALGAQELLADSHELPRKKVRARDEKAIKIWLGREEQEPIITAQAVSLKQTILAVVTKEQLGPLSHIKIKRHNTLYLLKWKEVDALSAHSLLLLPGDECVIYLKTIRK